MSIEAMGSGEGVISTRNGVPPENWLDSDPPGGVPRTPDPDTHPHPAPGEGGPQPGQQSDLPMNEPPQVPPSREAQGRVGERRVEVHRHQHHRHK